jgi:hypothetical protein
VAPRRGRPVPHGEEPDEVPMFARFVERGLALPASDFFKGLLQYYGIEYLNLNPNGIFQVSVFYISVRRSWGSSPTGSCSGNSSVRTFLRGVRGYQAPLDLVPEILLCEATTQRQRPTSSRRGWHPNARRRGRPVLGVQAHRLEPRLEGQVVLYHKPPPGAAEAKQETAETSGMVDVDG